jgi:hypothetical protein
MKYLNTFESADGIKSKKYNIHLKLSDSDALPFTWDDDLSKVYIGKFGKTHGYMDMYDFSNGLELYNYGLYSIPHDGAGRLWLKSKIISFWHIPKNLKWFFKELGNKIGEKIDDSWRVEYNEFGKYVEFVKVSDFIGTDINKEAYINHLDMNKNKNVIGGWGSKNSKNNREWRKALGENLICDFDEFILESKSYMKVFDYVAIQNNFKNQPILYVVDFKVISDDGNKVKCKVKGYSYNEIEDGKYGFCKINDYEKDTYHILNKTDFKTGTAKKKIYDIFV